MSRFLSNSLKANAVYSGSMGLIMLIFAHVIAELMGQWPMWIPAAIGAGLILFAGDLIWLGRRLRTHTSSWLRTAVIIVVSMDLLWVLSSVILLSISPAWISKSGQIVVAVVALPVLTLTIFQWKGLQQFAANDRAQQALS